MEMESSIESISDWIQSNPNHTFIIRKQELHNVDEIRIKIDHVEVTHNPHAKLDDYMAENALLLQGEGEFIGETKAALPQGTYEIALTEPWTANSEAGTLRIATDRASYILTPEPASSLH